MGIVTSASLVSACTLLSRVLGMVRDILCASLFGATAAWDAFAIAWRVPNLFRRLLGEGALSSAFIPTFAGERAKKGVDAAFSFFQTVLTLLTILLTAITVVGVALAAFLPGTLFGTGAGAEKAELTLSLLRILFPYVLLINVMALFMAILNTLDHFFAPAIAPALLNVFWIGGTLLAPVVADTPESQIKVLAVAILIGGGAQLAVQIPFLRARGVPLRPRLDLSHPALKRMLLLFIPMVLGVAPVQVNLLVDTAIAEAFVPGDGANSWLFYGNRLMQLPLALIGIALGIAIFPVFSRQAKEGEKGALGRTFSDALGISAFLALPAAAGLLALSGQLIALIFERGAFGLGDTRMTSDVLAMHALGLPAYCGLQVVTRLYYSLEEIRTPVRCGVLMVVLNLALNLLLVGPMGPAGLALATAASATVNLAILLLLVPRRLGVRGVRKVAKRAAAFLLLAAAMGAGVLGLSLLLQGAFPERTLPGKLAWAILPTVAGAAFYIGGAIVLRFPEARTLRRLRR
jgi:putative peptidoglycan lipid II flippase